MPFKSKEENLAYNKAYYEANKEEILAQQKAYHKANREEILAKKKTYYEANKEKLKAHKKAYYEANKEEILASNKAYKEANKEKLKAYKEANKEKYAAFQSNRRALKLKQIPVHLRDCPHEKQRVLQTYKLSSILTKATGVQHHVDHMWPLNDGGPHWSGNLQVIPAEENWSKNASVCEETRATIIKSLYTFESERSI